MVANQSNLMVRNQPLFIIMMPSPYFGEGTSYMSNPTNVNVQPLFNAGGLIDGEKAATNGEWMSVQEASNATGYSMGTLRRYIKSGKIKHRRRGRANNSKLEVLVTPALLPDKAGQTEFFGPEEDLEDDDTSFDEVDQPDQSDQLDQSGQPTMAWMCKKLDEKDELLKEKDAKIEMLAHELSGAHYRNGYLESEKSQFEAKLLLLEDKSRSSAVDSVQVEATEVSSEKPAGAWSKFSKWFVGK